jgi:cytochrome P450
VNDESVTATSIGNCPIVPGFDPLGPDYVRDPYTYMASYREQQPVFFAPELGFYVVTRYEDVESILLDQHNFSNRNVQDPLANVVPEASAMLRERFGLQPATSNCDPPRHTVIRKQLMFAFSPRRTRELEPRIHEVADELLDRFAADGRADLVERYTFPLPAYTMFALLGFPRTDADMLRQWCGNKLELVHGHASPEYQIMAAEAMCQFWEYCVDFVRDRVRSSADDLTSALIAQRGGQAEPLTDGEIASVLFQLAFAGHETTTKLTANLVRRLLEAPDGWRRICVDRSLVADAVDECLRHDSSVIAWRRTAVRDVEVGGVNVPKGSRILLSLASANHDPRRFEHPEQFVIDRSEAKRHISMGRGIHFCLGAVLGKREATIMVEHLADRLPSLRLAADDDYVFPRNITFRGPEHLWVTWSSASIGVTGGRSANARNGSEE